MQKSSQTSAAGWDMSHARWILATGNTRAIICTLRRPHGRAVQREGWVALQCRSAGAMRPRLFRGFLVPLDLLVLGGTCSASFKRVIAPLLRGRQGWDAQARHFEHEGPRPPALSAFIYCRAGSALLPRWTLLVNDDSYVIVRHLLRYASRFDASQPVLLGHALDKKEGLRAQHSHFRRHVRNVTLARNALQRSHASGVPWARGGAAFGVPTTSTSSTGRGG